jgi:hypothetical protein
MAVGKSLSDSLSVGESFSRAAIYNRSLTDATSLSDTQAITAEKSLSDSLSLGESFSRAAVYSRSLTDATSLSDAQALTASLSKADATSLSDTQAITAEKSLSDSLSVGESFSRVGTYSRTFTDAFSLDDIETHTNGTMVNKTNVFGLNDSFTHVLERQNHAVLNTSALNTFTFNSS